MTRAINTVIFLGSAKNVTPPWGGDKRLGDRVYNHVIRFLKERKKSIGGESINHKLTIFDPIQVFGKDGTLEESGAQVSAPVHFLPKEKKTQQMEEMENAIKQAHCIVVISPEYNHAAPSALLGMINHFGGSNFALKPSAIITYSPGPFGGMRAAMALRPFLAEVGCTSISKLTAYPYAGDMFDIDGTPKDPNNRMLKQLEAQINELEWMAIAMENMRKTVPDPQK